MRKLEKFSLYEALGKGEVVFTFGRFNPITTGHEKLINKVKSVAGSNDYKIFPHIHKIKIKTFTFFKNRIHAKDVS